MKKMTFLACAAMLTSAIALNSCKSDDPIGGFEGDAEVVKTEFAISLPNNVAGNGAKHMPSASVQPNGTLGEFQGMKGIILVPFATSDSIEGANTRLAKNIHLGDIAKLGAGSDDTLSASSHAKVYADVAIPLTTASFLFYGKSAATSVAAEPRFEIGSLLPDTASTLTTPSLFKFQLDSMLTATALTTAMTTGKGGLLMAYLTSIACASDGTKLWYQYGTGGDSLAMHNMFVEFSSMHGLSSFEVARVLTDLYQSLMPISSTISTGIKNAIKDGTTYVDVNTTTGVVTMKSGYDNFPGELKIPDGAIQIAWNGTSHQFESGNYDGLASPTKYVYPTSLWYYANSTILTSKKSQKDKFNNSNSWTTIKGNYGDGAAVNTLTRSVILEDSVQYAVARFDVKVKLASASMADNSLMVEGVATNVNCTEGFKVTGILVGGQNHVGYDFKPAAAGGYTIYDKVMTSTKETTPTDMKAMPAANFDAAQVNHTLVLESYAASDVRIAVEMENTTDVDFYGQGGHLIPKGGKFYVVAQLSAAAATETGGKVFKQDFTTTARLNLKSLKNAYNTIPDLRSPQLEIGFAVDLSWRSGHDYDNIDIE